MPDRVDDQVREHLADADRVGVERDGCPGRRRQRHALFLGRGRVTGHDIGLEAPDLDLLAVEWQRPRFCQGDRPEVVEEAVHDRDLGEDRGEVGVVERMDAIDHRLHAAADHLQRRAQLVGHVGEERLAV